MHRQLALNWFAKMPILGYWNARNRATARMLKYPARTILLTATVMAALLRFALANTTTPRTIDLSGYCNFALTNSPIGTGSLNGANNLATLAAGKNSYSATPFEVSGIIQLTGKQALLAGRNFPEKVEGIKVGSGCSLIHLLHGAGWSDLEKTTIANLVLHFSDGAQHAVPIVYGQHVFDWWENDEQPADKDTSVAWKGANKISTMFGTELRIYKTTFQNPKPGATIDHVDFISAKRQSAPFLLGLTVE